MKIRHTYYLASFVLLTFLFSCDENIYSPATVTFYPLLEAVSVEPELGKAGEAYVVNLKTSRVLTEESQINIRISGNGAGYGSSYVTSPPQVVPGIVTLTIPYGKTDASFRFIPRNDELFVPTDYKYTFSIEETSNEIRSIGQKDFKMTVADNTTPFFSESFDPCPGTKLTERLASGVSTWGCSTFGYPSETTSCREANAYGKGGSGDSNSYLINTTPINGSLYKELYVSAQVYSRYTGNGTIIFKYSTNYSGIGSPEAPGVVWTELTELNSALPLAGSQVWKEVGALIQGFGSSQVYVAIHHLGGSSSSSSSWRIDDLEIKGN